MEQLIETLCGKRSATVTPVNEGKRKEEDDEEKEERQERERREREEKEEAEALRHSMTAFGNAAAGSAAAANTGADASPVFLKIRTAVPLLPPLSSTALRTAASRSPSPSKSANRGGGKLPTGNSANGLKAAADVCSAHTGRASTAEVFPTAHVPVFM